MLPWVSEADFERELERLKTSYKDALNKAEERRKRNVVDPFSSLMIAETFGMTTAEELSFSQDTESATRGSSNAIGHFHQGILGSVAGWENYNRGYDLRSEKQKMIVELKNKHNTLNDNDKKGTIRKLSSSISREPTDWTAALVLIIPKTPIRYQTTIAHRVIEMEGASFYHLVTGHRNAIHQLFEHLSNRLSPSDEIRRYCKAILDHSLPP